MTGTLWTSAAILFTVAACGGPSNEGAPPAAPGAAAPAAPASPSPDGTGPAAAPAPAATAKASPSDPKSWPFAPAPTTEELNAQIDRLSKDWGPVKTNWTPPGKSDRYGRAEGFVAAPYEVVKARLLDFPHYKELAGPKFKKVSVVDKTAAGTDLYFQLPIMKGLVTIWYVTRFSTAKPALGGAEVIEGNFVKGNIKDMQIVFTLRQGPDQKTILTCDLNLAINVPAPQNLLDEELRDACGDAINAVRARVTPPPNPTPPG